MPTIHPTTPSRVTAISGSVSVRGPDGKLHLLHLGDLVQPNEEILTAQDGSVQLTPQDGGAAAWPDPAIAGGASPPAASDNPTAAPAATTDNDVDRAISNLNASNTADDAPGAGLAGGDGAGDLTPGLRVDRINEPVTPAAITFPVEEGSRLIEPRTGGVPNAQNAQVDTAPPTPPTEPTPPAQPTPIGADSTTITATEAGPAVNLGLTAPTGVSGAVVITVTQLPAVGLLLHADGTPVTVGSTLSAADLTALLYQPPADDPGRVPAGGFTYSVGDHGAIASGTVTIDLGFIDHAPLANADLASVPEGSLATGNVLANDTDPDGDALHVSQFTVGGTTYTAGSTATLAGVGTLAINADGSYTFAPAGNYNGPVPVATYTATDGTLTSTSTLSLTVTPVDHPPVANPDAASVLEGGSATGNVLANDTDPDGDALHVSQFTVGGTTYTAGSTATLAGVGTLAINADGSYTFTPAGNYSGPVPVATYTATDGTLAATSTLSLAVTPVDHPPVANPELVTLPEGSTATGNVLANDTDPDGDTLHVSQFTVGGTTYAAGATATLAGIGTLAINADGGYTFTSDPYYRGPVPVATYTATDGALTSTSTLSLAITPVDHPPVANPDAVTLPEGSTATGNVLANDTDPDGDTLHVSQFTVGGTTYAAGATATLAGIGTLAINADGGYTFTSDPYYRGPVPVATYTATDGTLTSDATLSLTITPVNHPPIANPDAAGATEAGGVANGTPGINPTGNVLLNDTDPDAGDSLSVSAVSGSAPGTVGGLTAGHYGVLTLNSDGSYAYAVNNALAAVQSLRTPGDTLTDTFTYSVRDAAGATSTTTLTVTVHGADDAPVAAPDRAGVLVDQPLSVAAAAGVLVNDTDVDGGDTQTVSGVSVNNHPGAVGSPLDGTYGQLTLNADGSYTYLANKPAAEALAPGHTATEQFSYMVTDTAGAASTSTLTITVTGVAHAPVALPDTHSTPEDTPLVVSAASGVLANDTDITPGAVLGVTQFTVAGVAGSFSAGNAAAIAGVGTLTINGDGSYSFTPVHDYNGPVPVATYTVSDGTLTSSSTLSLTVTPVNDPPLLNLNPDHTHNTVGVQAITGLFATGVDNNGAALAIGKADSHYTVVSEPANSTLKATTTGLAAWLANDAHSTWIGSVGNEPTGTYKYQTGFTLQAGADPASVHIAFDLASDNNLRDILVNGVSTGYTSNVQFHSLTHVQLNGVTSAFQSGANTITFVVDNRDPGSPSNSGPTGLRVENITGDVAVIGADAVNHQTDYASTWVQGTPVAISNADVSVQDVDSPQMQGATITLTNQQAGDLLMAGTLPAGISASVNAGGNVLTLSGAAPQASYAAAIHAVEFNNTSASPSGVLDRTVTVMVNDGQANSNVATATIHVVPVHASPTLDLDANDSTATGTGYLGHYHAGAAAVVVADTDTSIHDTASTTLHSATLHIANFQAGDLLAASGLPAGIVAADYDPTAGVLQLSGTATLAAYQTAIEGVHYSNTGAAPSTVTREIDVSVNDGIANSSVAISHISYGAAGQALVATPAATPSVAAPTVSADHSLVASSGSDVFAWTLGDHGTAGAPPTDTIHDFNLALPGSGGDVLDLRDLLQGEARSGTNAGNLQNYLDFDTTTNPGSTIIHVSSTGGFTAGYTAPAEDQRIVLQGVDVRSPGAFGLQPSASDSDVIHQLLQRGKLVTDGH